MFSLIFVIIIIVLILIFISLFAYRSMTSNFTLTKLYFVIISLVAIIGLTIGYGVALYEYASLRLISDEEYIAGSYRDIQSCKQPMLKSDGSSSPKSQTDVDQCIQEMKSSTLARRSKESKESILG